MFDCYVIYHIVGRKVGCTKNLEERMELYEEMDGARPKYEVLERLPRSTGDQGAGDREWEWADKLGLPRGPHYTITMHAVRVRGANGARRFLETVIPEQLSEWGKSGHLRRMEVTTFEQRSEWSRASGRAGIRGLDAIRTPEQHSKWSRHMRTTCPHCGFEGTIGPLYRWHFDNCRLRPVSTARFTRRAP
jgi:hypothetical protein